MDKAHQTHFDSLYQEHVNALIRQGKAEKTIEAYARAVRRIATYFDRCPDQLSVDDLKDYVKIVDKLKERKDPIAFLVKRGRSTTYIAVTPDKR